MTVQDYLLKFRKINSLESLEKLFDHLNYTLSDNQDIINCESVLPSFLLRELGIFQVISLYPSL